MEKALLFVHAHETQGNGIVAPERTYLLSQTPFAVLPCLRLLIQDSRMGLVPTGKAVFALQGVLFLQPTRRFVGENSWLAGMQ